MNAPRVFDTGASRDSDHGKHDLEAFNSPIVDQRYAEYMHENRLLKDGSLRAGDDWTRGLPREETLKSLMRHVQDVRLLHRGYVARSDIEHALCGVIFNAKSYLYELLTERGYGKEDQATEAS